jgi:hypothetical protein
MKLQELISNSELDMTLPQVKAFFLGAMSAQKPMTFPKALEELLSPAPEEKAKLEGELKVLWEELSKNRPAELQKLFPEEKDTLTFLTLAKDQIDYFLTAMSLAGTSYDTVQNEEIAGILDEMEDNVMDLDEYVTQENPDKAEGEELKEFILQTWEDFLRTHK